MDDEKRTGVLVIGGDERLRHALEFLVNGVRVRLAGSPAETEGLGTDVIVLAGPRPIADLKEVRVHPMLHSTPVILLAPGLQLEDRDWRAVGVSPITEPGVGLLDELTEHLRLHVARAHHPAAQGRLVAGLKTAS